MKITRKTEISIQQTKRLVFSIPKTEAVFNCPHCESKDEMLIAEQAASVFGCARREIYRRVEAGQIHFVETTEGILYICPASFEIKE